MLNNLLNIKFHHLGVAVKDMNQCVSFYKSLGYKCSELVIDPLQKVKLIMCSHGQSPNIELISPLSDNSPVSNYLKQNDIFFYHICYETGNIKKSLDALKNNFRIICVSKPKRAVLFNGRKFSFYYVEGAGLIELLEAK